MRDANVTTTGRWSRSRHGLRDRLWHGQIRRYWWILTISTLLVAACQRAPDRVLTAASHSFEPRAQGVGSTQKSGNEQRNPSAQLCSDITFPVVGQGARGKYPFTMPEDPSPVSDGLRKIVAVYTPPDVVRPQILTILHTNGSAPPAVHSVPLTPRVEQHPWLVASSQVHSITVAADRWLMPMTTTTLIDFSRLLPGSLEHDAITVHSISDGVYGPQQIEGLELSGYCDGSDGDLLPFRCFASWEQMDTTPELVSAYSLGAWDRNEQFVLRKSSYMLTARWGEAPIRTESPINHANCCNIRVLDTGFASITHRVPPSTYPDLIYAPAVHYSPDGLTWERVAVPTRYHGFGGEELPIWVCSVRSDATGVIVREAIGNIWTIGCADATFWSADEDLTNWRKLLAPPPGYG